MITAEIKINGELIADIRARNIRTVSDHAGDFIGDRATVCEYECDILSDSSTISFTVQHDRRLGWQGLISKITKEIIPVVIETVTVENDV